MYRVNRSSVRKDRTPGLPQGPNRRVLDVGAGSPGRWTYHLGPPRRSACQTVLLRSMAGLVDLHSGTAADALIRPWDEIRQAAGRGSGIGVPEPA